jgi:hypothetical protein
MRIGRSPLTTGMNDDLALAADVFDMEPVALDSILLGRTTSAQHRSHHRCQPGLG